MHSQLHFWYGYEIARSRQATILAEVEQCRIGREAEIAQWQEMRERRRFFRAYLLRSILFRLAPNWAARLER